MTRTVLETLQNYICKEPMTSSTSPFTDGHTGSQHTLPGNRRFRSGKVRIRAQLGPLQLGSLSHSAEVQYRCTLYASVFLKFFWLCSFCSQCSHTVHGTGCFFVHTGAMTICVSNDEVWFWECSGFTVECFISGWWTVIKKMNLPVKVSGLQFMYLYWQVSYQKFF